jgi:hypothetical protein
VENCYRVLAVIDFQVILETAARASERQGQHCGFFLSLRSNYGSNQAARASEQPGGGQGQNRSLFLYYPLRSHYLKIRIFYVCYRILTGSKQSSQNQITAQLRLV